MKILVVVDMQNDFIDGALGTPNAQAIVDNVVKKVNEFDGDAIYITKDTHQPNYMETQEGKALPIVPRVLLAGVFMMPLLQQSAMRPSTLTKVCRYSRRTHSVLLIWVRILICFLSVRA